MIDPALKRIGARQADLLRFVAGYQEANDGVSPTVRECAAGVGIAGLQSTVDLLDELECSGAIRRLPNRARAMQVVGPVAIPRSPAGEPLFFAHAHPALAADAARKAA